MSSIFICYHNGDYHIVEKMKKECAACDIKVLTSKRGIEDIKKWINSCYIFLIILSNNIIDDHVALEQIKFAYKYLVKEKLDFLILQKNNNISAVWEGFDYAGRANKIDISERFDAEEVAQVIKKVKDIIRKIEINNKGGVLKIFKHYHYANEYIMKSFDKDRVKIQQRLLKRADQPIYNKIFDALYEDINVLNICSGFEKLILDRIENKKHINKFIGINVKRTESSEPQKDYSFYTKYYTMNCEDSKFVSELNDITLNEKIEKFDLVIISMVLLHLKAPYLFLKNIRNFIKKGGKIIILDIDDGINIAYPDRFQDFARVFSICDYCEKSGYRKSGRELFTYLKKVGMKNISLEILGINTIGMDFEQREELFDVYFNFIPEVMEDMIQKYPDNENIQEDYIWLNTRFDSIMEQFYETDFFFVLGFIIITAER